MAAKSSSASDAREHEIMQFGLFNLMSQRDRAKPAREIFAEMIDQVRLVESIGFDVAWFAEHHFSNYCLCPSPLAMATYFAGVTEKIRLGTAVIVAPLYQPLRMLEDIAVLDNLSDGRAVIGFGSGYQQYEFHKFGVELKQGRDILLETLDVFEQFLARGVVAYEGKHIRIPETHFSVRLVQQRPGIYVAGLGGDPETQGRLARSGYVPFFATGWGRLEEIRAVRDKTAAAYAAAGGDPADTPYACQRYVFVTDDREEARRAADGARYIRRVAMAMRNRYAELEGSFLKEVPAPDEPPLDEIVDRLLIGDPETVAAKLIREIEALRPTHMSCFMALPGIEQKRILKSMERFGGEVLPRLVKHFGSLEAIGAAEPHGALIAKARRATA
jgi:alkanesulfonate monooxygenase SsuD/methylene tetrahydromethanopterin reductase-like flavin-dependent oxidoreductase (luciferase family)